jgi:F-type H+-transporting ATPase subunit epsilon
MPNNKTQPSSSTDIKKPQLDAQLMQLQVLLPSKIFATYQQVESLVLESPEGAFGLMPQRQDCVSAIEPGILSYTLHGQKPRYLALDEGVMVKNGKKVSVSVRKAHAGEDLEELKQIVQNEFVTLSEQDREARAVLARLESSFMRGFKSLKTNSL